MLNASEVAKHNTRQSCWVIINSQVYDVTSYLNQHPGGSRILLQYGGKDATAVYEPIHPEGTIEQALAPDKHLGPVDPTTIQTSTQQASASNDSEADRHRQEISRQLSHCFNVNDIMDLSAEKYLGKAGHVYFKSAADGLGSLSTNADDWRKVSLRPRILRNVRRVNTSRSMLGSACKWPICIAPAARAQLAHPDGELCLARTAARTGIAYCVSSVASIPHADISTAFHKHGRGDGNGALWFQLYVAVDKSVTLQRIKAAREGGYSALVITVDSAVIGKREEDERYRAEISAEDLAASFAPPLDSPTHNEDDEDATAPREVHASTFCWDDLAWIREAWGNTGHIALKGIQSVEDAVMAVEYGVNAIYLSNHGGRQCDDAPSAVRTLLEIRRFAPWIIEERKVGIYLDGGIRRGADVVKAVCLGATGIAMGRPFMYAVAFGDEGVEKVVQLLTDEIQTTMRLIGATSLDQLSPSFVNTKVLEAELPDRVDFSRQTRTAKL